MAQDFDSLMAEMGVKPMNKAKEKVVTTKKTKRIPAKKTPQRPKAPLLDERLEALQRELDIAKQENEQAEAKAGTLKKKLRAARKKVTALEAAVQAPKRSVSEVLHEWGFQTPAERAALLRQEIFLERIISNPCLEEDLGLKVEISQSVMRVCSHCEVPDRMVAIHVHEAHCSICGGVDMLSASRKFADAALLNGRLRIVIVGRSTMHHRILRRFIGRDKRMVVTQLPGDIRRDTAAAQTDVEHADVVVVWDPDSLAPALLEVYRSAKYGGAVPAGSVGELIEQATGFIGAD